MSYTFLGIFPYSYLLLCLVLHILACDRTFETISEFRVPFAFQSGFPHVVGSCNGILCFTNYNAPGSNVVVYLWNPSIRKFKRLPDNQFPIEICGIGYDSQNNDFKVVGISRTFAKSKPPPGPEVGVYSLNSDSWKRVELGISLRPNVFYCDVNCYKALPFVSGHLHWMLKTVEYVGGQQRHSADMLLSFDVNSEKFKQQQQSSSLCSESLEAYSRRMALATIGIEIDQFGLTCALIAGKYNWYQFAPKCVCFIVYASRKQNRIKK